MIYKNQSLLPADLPYRDVYLCTYPIQSANFLEPKSVYDNDVVIKTSPLF